MVSSWKRAGPALSGMSSASVGGHVPRSAEPSHPRTALVKYDRQIMADRRATTAGIKARPETHKLPNAVPSLGMAARNRAAKHVMTK